MRKNKDFLEEYPPVALSVNTEPEQSSSNPMTQFPTYRVRMHYLYLLICVFVVVYRDSGESVDIIPIVHLMWRLCAAAAGVR